MALQTASGELRKLLTDHPVSSSEVKKHLLEEKNLSFEFSNNKLEPLHYRIWTDKYGNLYLSFRGTHNIQNVGTDVTLHQVRVDPTSLEEIKEPKSEKRKCSWFNDKQAIDALYVHCGFWSMYLKVRMEIMTFVETRVRKSETTPALFVTGHSLGGALAALAAYDLAIKMPSLTVECVTFGAPAVGNQKFKELFENNVSKSCRIFNKLDPVPPALIPANAISTFTKSKHVVKNDYVHAGCTVCLYADITLTGEAVTAVTELVTSSNRTEIYQSGKQFGEIVGKFHGYDLYVIGLNLHLNPFGSCFELAYDKGKEAFALYRYLAGGEKVELEESLAEGETKGKSKGLLKKGFKTLKATKTFFKSKKTSQTEAVAVNEASAMKSVANGKSVAEDNPSECSPSDMALFRNMGIGALGVDIMSEFAPASLQAHLHNLGRKMDAVQDSVIDMKEKVEQAQEIMSLLGLNVNNSFKRIDGKLDEVVDFFGVFQSSRKILSTEIGDADLRSAVSNLKAKTEPIATDIKNTFRSFKKK